MRYSIEGEPLPVVICNLEQGEVMITESGAMSWMSPNMKMETTGGGIGKMFGRALSGESIFLNRYTAMNGNGMIAFASSFPGSIRAFDIVPGQDLIVQKSAFLAAVSSVDLSVFFQQRIGSGLFGGPGQQIVVDTGYLAAMTGSCKIEVKTVPGVKNMLFGGEGIFNTVITGPGRVWLQSMPIAQMANTLRPYFPSNNH